MIFDVTIEDPSREQRDKHLNIKKEYDCAYTVLKVSKRIDDGKNEEMYVSLGVPEVELLLNTLKFSLEQSKYRTGS
jgi:hypothetical protein